MYFEAAVPSFGFYKPCGGKLACPTSISEQKWEPMTLEPGHVGKISFKCESGKRIKIHAYIPSDNLASIDIELMKKVGSAMYIPHELTHEQLNSISQIHDFVSKPMTEAGDCFVSVKADNTARLYFSVELC